MFHCTGTHVAGVGMVAMPTAALCQAVSCLSEVGVTIPPELAPFMVSNIPPPPGIGLPAGPRNTLGSMNALQAAQPANTSSHVTSAPVAAYDAAEPAPALGSGGQSSASKAHSSFLSHQEAQKGSRASGQPPAKTNASGPATKGGVIESNRRAPASSTRTSQGSSKPQPSVASAGQRNQKPTKAAAAPSPSPAAPAATGDSKPSNWKGWKVSTAPSAADSSGGQGTVPSAFVEIQVSTKQMQQSTEWSIFL